MSSTKALNSSAGALGSRIPTTPGSSEARTCRPSCSCASAIRADARLQLARAGEREPRQRLVHPGAQLHAEPRGLAADDLEARLGLGRGHVDDQPAGELAVELLADVDLGGGERGREDDLRPRPDDLVPDAQQLLLGAAAPGQQVHVVQEDDVALQQLVGERLQGAGGDGGGDVVDQLVGGAADDVEVGATVQRQVADGVQQVRLADAGLAVEEERVVAGARRLGGTARGGRGHLAAGAGDEGVEGEARVRLEPHRLGDCVGWLGADGWMMNGKSYPATPVEARCPAPVDAPFSRRFEPQRRHPEAGHLAALSVRNPSSAEGSISAPGTQPPERA